jgi:hypothetical protein
MSDDITEPRHFCCACYSDEHTLRFWYFPDDEDGGEIYTTIMINEYEGFWSRLKAAAKYLLGHRCKYGHFDSFTLMEKDLGPLISLLEAYKADMGKRRTDNQAT